MQALTALACALLLAAGGPAPAVRGALPPLAGAVGDPAALAVVEGLHARYLGAGSMAELRADKRLQADFEAGLRGLTKERGWPGVKRLGPRGAAQALNVARQVQDKAFARWCMEQLAPLDADPRGDLPRNRRRAESIDQLLMRAGLPQRYGTAMDLGGAQPGWTPWPIADAPQVDARRRALGLQPLADELSAWNTLRPLDRRGAKQRTDDLERLAGWLLAHGYAAHAPGERTFLATRIVASRTPYIPEVGRVFPPQPQGNPLAPLAPSLRREGVPEAAIRASGEASDGVTALVQLNLALERAGSAERIWLLDDAVLAILTPAQAFALDLSPAVDDSPTDLAE